MPDREEAQNSVLLAALEPAVNHVFDLSKCDCAQCSLEMPRLAVAFRRFPAEPIGHQHKRAGLPIVSEIAYRNERVLYASGDDGKVFGVLGTQPKRAVR